MDQKTRAANDLIIQIAGGKTQAERIMAEVRENIRKLDSCILHDFSIDLTPGRPWGKKWQCSKCGGEVDCTKKQWYELGIKHEKEGS